MTKRAKKTKNGKPHARMRQTLAIAQLVYREDGVLEKAILTNGDELDGLIFCRHEPDALVHNKTGEKKDRVMLALACKPRVIVPEAKDRRPPLFGPDGLPIV